MWRRLKGLIFCKWKYYGAKLKRKKDLVNLNLKRKFTSAFAVLFYWLAWFDGWRISAWSLNLKKEESSSIFMYTENVYAFYDLLSLRFVQDALKKFCRLKKIMWSREVAKVKMLFFEIFLNIENFLKRVKSKYNLLSVLGNNEKNVVKWVTRTKNIHLY